MTDRESRSTRILVVEDMEDTRDAFTRLLTAEGADVVATGSGREAIEIVAGDDFDVLLTDLGLPDIPGDIVIREVLARARHRPRIVVVTGYVGPQIEGARRAGADVVLTKPVTWEVLRDNLSEGGFAAPEGGFAHPPKLGGP